MLNHSFIFLLRLLILLKKKKMGKMRLFVTDLLPGMFLKILVNLC